MLTSPRLIAGTVEEFSYGFARSALLTLVRATDPRVLRRYMLMEASKTSLQIDYVKHREDRTAFTLVMTK